MQAIEKAQEWFQGQLSNVQERIRSLGKTGGGNVNESHYSKYCVLFFQFSFTCISQDYSFEAQQERLGFKITRIEEVSRQLMMLIENADRGLPIHMNLALIDRNKIAKTLESNTLDDSNGDEVGRMLRRLKIQNHQLTEVCQLSCASERLINFLSLHSFNRKWEERVSVLLCLKKIKVRSYVNCFKREAKHQHAILGHSYFITLTILH